MLDAHTIEGGNVRYEIHGCVKRAMICIRGTRYLTVRTLSPQCEYISNNVLPRYRVCMIADVYDDMNDKYTTGD